MSTRRRSAFSARPGTPAPMRCACCTASKCRDIGARRQYPCRQGDGRGVSAFLHAGLPRLVEWEKVDWTKLDAVFCGLPHGTTQEITAAVMAANPTIKILDMSADFRLRDMNVYAQWYGREHRAPELQGEAVYGLTEFYREQITAARLVACPGCYPTARCLRWSDREGEADRRRRHRH